MVYEPENYENVERNFRFPAVGNLLQRETEVGCSLREILANIQRFLVCQRFY